MEIWVIIVLFTFIFPLKLVWLIWRFVSYCSIFLTCWTYLYWCHNVSKSQLSIRWVWCYYHWHRCWGKLQNKSQVVRNQIYPMAIKMTNIWDENNWKCCVFLLLLLLLSLLFLSSLKAACTVHQPRRSYWNQFLTNWVAPVSVCLYQLIKHTDYVSPNNSVSMQSALT